MKRLLCFILSMLFIINTLSGCGNNPQTELPASSASDRFSVVCTIFPQYDWARNIIGDNTDAVDLTLMSDNGVDMHSFQPTVDDIVKLSGCDLFIYVGGESDEWVTEALSQAKNPDMTVVNLLDVLGDGAKTEEIIEGMEEPEEGEEEEAGHGQARDLDEHVWLSLTNAELFTAAIADAFSALDPTNADIYGANAHDYILKLQDLDAKYQLLVSASNNATLIFGDRFPFRYLADDYGLSYYAAFPGCSAETEASFDTVIFLAEKFDELKLNDIVVTESADKSIANTILQNTSAKEPEIITLNSLQSVKAEDIEDGTTYLSVMEENLIALKHALNTARPEDLPKGRQ